MNDTQPTPETDAIIDELPEVRDGVSVDAANCAALACLCHDLAGPFRSLFVAETGGHNVGILGLEAGSSNAGNSTKLFCCAKSKARYSASHTMTTTVILQKLTTILVELIGCCPEEVTPEKYLHPVQRPHNNLDHLGADSLDIVELVMAVEEEFGIDIPDEEAAKLLTVQDWITHLQANDRADLS